MVTNIGPNNVIPINNGQGTGGLNGQNVGNYNIYLSDTPDVSPTNYKALVDPGGTVNWPLGGMVYACTDHGQVTEFIYSVNGISTTSGSVNITGGTVTITGSITGAVTITNSTINVNGTVNTHNSQLLIPLASSTSSVFVPGSAGTSTPIITPAQWAAIDFTAYTAVVLEVQINTGGAGFISQTFQNNLTFGFSEAPTFGSTVGLSPIVAGAWSFANTPTAYLFGSAKLSHSVTVPLNGSTLQGNVVANIGAGVLSGFIDWQLYGIVGIQPPLAYVDMPVFQSGATSLNLPANGGPIGGNMAFLAAGAGATNTSVISHANGPAHINLFKTGGTVTQKANLDLVTWQNQAQVILDRLVIAANADVGSVGIETNLPLYPIQMQVTAGTGGGAQGNVLQ